MIRILPFMSGWDYKCFVRGPQYYGTWAAKVVYLRSLATEPIYFGKKIQLQLLLNCMGSDKVTCYSMHNKGHD